MDTKRKSLFKSISWRLTASFTTLLIVLLISGELKLAGTIMGIEAVTKFIVYYFHERFWSRVEV